MDGITVASYGVASKDKQECFKSLFGANIDVLTDIWN
jgi:hypothetical protein